MEGGERESSSGSPGKSSRRQKRRREAARQSHMIANYIGQADLGVGGECRQKEDGEEEAFHGVDFTDS